MDKPIVSVIMPSYNHVSFVANAVKSVLDQTFANFEVIVADDGSTDGTQEVLKSITDPRLRVFLNEKNRGAGAVTADLIQAAVGRYVALINSDDMWSPTKLSEQLAVLDNSDDLGVCLSKVRYIDHAGRGVPKTSMQWGHVFDRENRSRGEWLRHFLFNGNCFCNPSALVKREVYDKCGVYDNRLRQLPDFDFWIRVVKHFNVHILDRELVDFRVLPGEANASGDTPVNAIRVMNEYALIAESFFDGVDEKLFREGFGDLMRRPDLSGSVNLMIEKAFVLLSDAPWLGHMFSLLALKKIYALLGDVDTRKVLERDYRFSIMDYHALLGRVSTLRPDLRAQETSVTAQVASPSDVSEYYRGLLKTIAKSVKPFADKPSAKIISINDLQAMYVGSGYFDAEWYLQNYTDVARAGVDPGLHYLIWGALEDRLPSAEIAEILS